MRKKRYNSGKNHPNWKGGRHIDKSGYVLLRRPRHPHRDSLGYVREHRLKMEQKLGRYLDVKEVVHHVNGNRGDNRLRNLVLYSGNGLHLQAEITGRKNPEQSARMKRWLRERPEWRAHIAEAAKISNRSRGPNPKRSERMKAWIQTPEGQSHLEKMVERARQSTIGKPAWNRGISPSEETRAKLRLRPGPNLGKSPSEETRRKLSEAAKQRKMTPEWKAHLQRISLLAAEKRSAASREE